MVIVARLKVKSGTEAEMERAFREMMPKVEQEEGTLAMLFIAPKTIQQFFWSMRSTRIRQPSTTTAQPPISRNSLEPSERFWMGNLQWRYMTRSRR